MAVLVMLSAMAVPMTQSDGDLFAHIAAGRRMLTDGPPVHVSPAWGSAALFAWLHGIGGLPFVLLGVAVTAAITHAMVVRYLMQSALPTRIVVVAAALGVTLAASHWLARPHAFSLLGAAVLVLVLTSARRRAHWGLVPLFGIWANLHGGWSYGLLLLVAYSTAGYVDRWRTRARTDEHVAPSRTAPRIGVVLLAALMTFATPYGGTLHATVLRTLGDAELARTIREHRPPSFDAPVDVLFLLVVVLAAIGLWRTRGRIPLPVATLILLSAVAGVRASRHVALFAVTGWPLLVVHVGPHVVRRAWREVDRTGPAWYGALPGAIACVAALIVGSHGGVLFSRPVLRVPIDARRFPVAALDRLHDAPPVDPLLTTWAWSGYVPYASSGRRAWFDPLRFTPAEMRTLGQLLTVAPGWRATLDRLGIVTVLVERDAPLARALEQEPQWRVRYRDATAVALQRCTKQEGRTLTSRCGLPRGYL